jgi:opacity protein-like surface antigen
VRPLNWLAAEVDYIDLGSASSTYNTGLGIGKAGVAFSRLDFEFYSPGIGGGFASNGTGFAWGIGVQAHVSMIGARLEYEDLKIPNSSGAKLASLSVFLNL